jgi:hypothetical protein
MAQEFIENLEPGNQESIEEFLENLVTLRDFLKREEKTSLLPFLEAYLRITKEVKELSEQGGFENPEALEDLDLEFGRLYLEPMKDYLENGEKQEPWKTYFEYIERDDSIPLLELALGINSHINADLATAVRKRGYRNRSDFRKVNRILRKNLGPMLRYLALKHRDLASIGVLSFPPLAFKGLSRIEDWRDLTWSNAHFIDFSVKEVNRKTEENGREMIEIVHRTDLSGILKKPRQIMETRVNLSP